MDKQELKERFQLYTELYKHEAEIKAQKELLKKELEQEMIDNELDKVEMQEIGSFTLLERKIFGYSEDVKKKENDVKLLKKEEEKQGKAKVVKTTQYLRYSPLKTN
jgi:hypothetical protein